MGTFVCFRIISKRSISLEMQQKFYKVIGFSYLHEKRKCGESLLHIYACPIFSNTPGAGGSCTQCSTTHRGQGPAVSVPPGTSLDPSAQAPPQTGGIRSSGVGVSNLRLWRIALQNIVFVADFSTAKVWKHRVHNVTWEILESRAVLQGFPLRRRGSRFPLSNIVAVRHKWQLST